MSENYLPLNNNPLVNIRRAIKRSNQQRKTNTICQANSSKDLLKELLKKSSIRNSVFENRESPTLKIKIKRNQSEIKQQPELKSGQVFGQQFQEQKTMMIHKRDRQYRVRRYNNSQIRQKNNRFLIHEQKQKINLQSNLTVYNLVPRHYFSQKPSYKRLTTMAQTLQSTTVALKKSSKQKHLKLLSAFINKRSRAKKSSSKSQFCAWQSQELPNF